MPDSIYFAWVDEDEEFDEDVHNRRDEDIFAFVFDHSEGDFAGMQLEIKNPRIGLLNPGRKVWGILSYSDGTTITPIFRGRIIGVPSNVFDTVVTIDFVARPTDYSEQKLALANTLKVAPYWDPIFVSPNSWNDPDAVLEARSALWHIDPVTLVLTLSNVLTPEDGTEDVAEDEHYYDDMSLTLSQTPLRAVTMIATIPWTQSAAGNVDLTARILNIFFPDQIPNSFTMNGLISAWPKVGSKFGSGWEVVQSSMIDVSYSIQKAPVPVIFEWQGLVPTTPIGSFIFPVKTTGEFHWGETAGFDFKYEVVIAALGYARPDLIVNYTAGREMAQVVTFTLQSDQQSIVTMPGEDEAMVITLNANKVSDPTEDATIPIGDVRKRGFIHTTRGLQAVEHLLLVARAHLIARSRTVEIAIATDFKTALRLRSLRKAILLHDHRLPGGEAIGKIIKVQLSVDGSSGEAKGVITIASCVGKGGSHSTSPGTSTYADDVFDNVSEYTNVIVLTDTADIAWTIPDPVTFDDGLDFIAGLNSFNSVELVSLANGTSSQRDAIEAASAGPDTDQAAISTLLQTIPTQITVQMKPMEGGPFQDEVVVSVSDLIIPKQIDLEAPSNA
jgi:hypothetical protein